MAVEEKKEDFKGHRQKCENLKKIANSRASKSGRNKTGYPPNVTVDDLCLYRKKRPALTWPKDNLKLEKGDFKSLKSEYKRRFKNFFDAINKSLYGHEFQEVLTVKPLKPEVSLKLEGLHDFQSEYNESFTEPSIEGVSQPSKPLKIMDNGPLTSQLEGPETTSQITSHSYIDRPHLLKRPTNLKLEGDFLHVTEHAEKFIEYLLAKRSELCRTPTTLKLEGEMETKTENRDKFIKYDNLERAPLYKTLSNLHLEGELHNVTEKQEQFVAYELTKRPPLTKKSTNLHLEGDYSLIPEYRRQYIDYKSLERPKLALPVNHLKTGGLFENDGGDVTSFDKKMHPLIPFLRGSDTRTSNVTSHTYRSSEKLATNRMSTFKSSSHPNLYYPRDSNIVMEKDMKPEYTNSYGDFYKQGKISPKMKRRREPESSFLKADEKISVEPEYTSSYVNYPRQRPHIHKPESHLSSEGEVYYTTEKSEKYTPYAVIQKTESCKREPELKLEGRFECQPEYRKAYIDYLIREKKPSATKKRRAFELISTNNEETNDNVSEPPSVEEKEIPKSKSNLNIPIIRTQSPSVASSAPSSPKSTKRSPSRLKKLSQLESSAFGPRCPLPKSRRSTTPSPGPQDKRERKFPVSSRGSSPTIGKSEISARKRNLVYPPTTKTLEQNRWSDSTESEAAFLILDERVPNKKISTNSLYKEQKWMPSWNYSIQ